MASWLWSVVVWLDQGLNVLFGPALNLLLGRNLVALFGHHDETLSSVLGKNVRAGVCIFCKWICKLLHLLDPDHCNKSIEDDRGISP